MSFEQGQEAIENGIQSAEQGNTLFALHCFNKVPMEKLSPLALSYLAYCIAKEHKVYKKALEYGLRALQFDKSHPLIYLNIGRIYLAAGYEKKAVETFRKGLKVRKHPLLAQSIDNLSPRKRSFLPFLDRDNHLNVLCGKLRSRFF